MAAIRRSFSSGIIPRFDCVFAATANTVMRQRCQNLETCPSFCHEENICLEWKLSFENFQSKSQSRSSVWRRQLSTKRKMRRVRMKFWNKITGIVLIVCCMSSYFTFVLGKSSTKALYDKSDCVIILDKTNFYKNLIGSDSIWIIEFYNSWCGHCQIFAPRWKEFAKQHAAWRPVIKISAIDCAEQNNTDICRKYDVEAFPSFRIFQPYTTVNDLGELYQKQNLTLMKQKLLDFAENVTDPPEHWPKLAPIKSMEHIWDEAKDIHKHMAFIFEEENSYVGREVILDTFQYSQLLVRRMLKEAVKKFVVTVFPSMYLINRDGTFTKLAKKNSTKEGLVGALKSLLTTNELAVGDQHVKQIEMEMKMYSKEQEPVTDLQTRKAGVYMQDLESTLSFMFRQEIAIHRTIEDDKLTALKDFVNVLTKYFPGREEVTDYLHIVNNWLKGESDLTGDHWLSDVEELQTVDKFLPDNVEWVGCEGSKPRYRGYPCGMWTLFHTLTVSGYQMQRQNPKDLPLDILAAIKGYMKHFFGCQTCVHHFLAMVDKITSADKHPDGAVMWLWKAHNQANGRLHGDPSEDPKHPKVQFPTRSMCQACYHGDNIIEKEVFKFLLKFYGKEGIIYPDKDIEDSERKPELNPDNKALDWWELHQRKKDLEKIKSLRSKKLEKTKQKRERLKYELAVRPESKFDRFDGLVEESNSKSTVISGWGFSNIDMGMCVFFYIMCTVLLMTLYYHFIVRKKYRPFQFLLPK